MESDNIWAVISILAISYIGYNHYWEQEEITISTEPQSGRYQIAIQNDHEALLIDTVTGNSWYRIENNNDKKEDNTSSHWVRIRKVVSSTYGTNGYTKEEIEEMFFKLKKAGYTDEQIDEYAKIKGLKK
jgi:hypothetical protein